MKSPRALSSSPVHILVILCWNYFPTVLQAVLFVRRQILIRSHPFSFLCIWVRCSLPWLSLWRKPEILLAWRAEETEIHRAMNFLRIFKSSLCVLAKLPVKARGRGAGFPLSLQTWVWGQKVGKGQSLANCITQILFLIKALGFGSMEEADGNTQPLVWCVWASLPWHTKGYFEDWCQFTGIVWLAEMIPEITPCRREGHFPLHWMSLSNVVVAVLKGRSGSQINM